ncbi:hypothetical protein V6246_18140 [Algibacter sp. TI.3.09]|uniref:hypothetical protein n=1 Tax=Algibacter sp. TI.3.09 TaxID=3121298 RepID=UPI00311F199E
MKYDYILYFNNSRPSKLELLYALNRELKSFGIENELDVRNSKKIKATYQSKQFEITFENFKNFSQTLRILTDEQYNLSNRIGIITLIWRLMNWRFKVDYGQMELLKKESFDLINERFENRFINQIKLHSLLETEFKPVDFELKKQDDGQKEITIGYISLDNVNSNEEAWISFSAKLDYDGWDTVNNEFIPITLEEYKTESLEFTKYWEMPNNSMQLEEETNIVSILKIDKSWDFIEYLVLRENSMQYISTNVWTG